MSNHSDKEQNSLEKQLEELREMQKNANNTGSSIGSGKASLFYKNLFKSPIIMLIAGVILGIPIICNLVNNLCIENILSNSIIILLSGALIYGGIIRIIKRK